MLFNLIKELEVFEIEDSKTKQKVEIRKIHFFLYNKENQLKIEIAPFERKHKDSSGVEYKTSNKDVLRTLAVVADE